jgi:hypothetical protein
VSKGPRCWEYVGQSCTDRCLSQLQWQQPNTLRLQVRLTCWEVGCVCVWGGGATAAVKSTDK